MKKQIRIAFAGDKAIAVQVLKFILKQGVKPLALLVTDQDETLSWKALVKLCPNLDSKSIFKNDEFKTKASVRRLKVLNLDYIISVHFPYIFPETVLGLPRHRILNLHPAYLPYNRGWHTPTWAILSDSPFGATLHFMDKTVDTGDILHQKKINIRPEDTANSLYQRVLTLELQVFKEAWPKLANFKYKRTPQIGVATAHKKKDIKKIQRIKAGPLIDRLRALTTNKLSEAGYFVVGNKKFRVRITITPEVHG